MITPISNSGSSPGRTAASSNAQSAATRASCVIRSVCGSSRPGRYSAAANPSISPASWAGYPSGTNREMRPMPLVPLRVAVQ